MEGSPQREVVLEIEHVKIVRKRAQVSLRFCRDCKKTTDFVSVSAAAELFSTTPVELFEFVQANSCHVRVEGSENVFICLSDLLSAMSRKLGNRTIKLLGARNNNEERNT